MKTGIITFSDFHGRQDVGSTKIRANWIMDAWHEAGPDIETIERFKMGGKYDAIIFQKVYWTEYAKNFRGIKILDVCDPDFRYWSYPVMEMVGWVDAVTCSSQALADVFKKATDKPVIVIPDRISQKHVYRIKAKHEGEGKTVAWFGYPDNFPVLDDILPILHKNGFSLIVVSSKPYTPPMQLKGFDIVNYPWTDETAYHDIARADIVINPKRLKGKWKYKSDNKTTIAYALGLPVAHTIEELLMFKDPIKREEAVAVANDLIKKDYLVQKSVEEWKNLICSLRKDNPTTNT